MSTFTTRCDNMVKVSMLVRPCPHKSMLLWKPLSFNVVLNCFRRRVILEGIPSSIKLILCCCVCNMIPSFKELIPCRLPLLALWKAASVVFQEILVYMPGTYEIRGVRKDLLNSSH